MATVSGKMKANAFSVELRDRIDTSNAAQVEADIMALIPADAPGLVLDCEELNYISSAGLRVILRLKKKYPELRVINTSPEVYEIFEMTGFSQMMTVEKAYRRVSIDGCEVIGRGANGEVYRLDPETIIKVYLNPDSLEEIKNEREVARKALVLGIPTAISYDVVRVGDSYASMFEMIDAKSFAKILIEDPARLDELIPLYVDLLKTIHGTVVPEGELPDQTEVAINWVYRLQGEIPEDLYQALKEIFQAVPKDPHMVHGDYHIKNVMYQAGEPILIDMDTLCVGDPVYEFSSIWLAYQGFCCVDHDQVEKFLGIPYDLATELYQKTLAGYLGTDDPAVLEKYDKKAQLCGYTRLLSRALRKDRDNQALISHAMEMLQKLVKEVEVLQFNE